MLSCFPDCSDWCLKKEEETPKNKNKEEVNDINSNKETKKNDDTQENLEIKKNKNENVVVVEKKR